MAKENSYSPTLRCAYHPPRHLPCGRYLVNPSQFSSVGIEDDEFFTDRGQLELRKLFESTGYHFSQEVNDDTNVLNPSTILILLPPYLHFKAKPTAGEV